MATHSSVIAWEIPRIEEPGRLQSMRSQNWTTERLTLSLSALCTTYMTAYYTYLNNAAKSLQSCPTLCNPIDGSPSGSPVPGILHSRTLEWVAISFSNA